MTKQTKAAFTANARAFAGAETTVATALKALGELLKPFVKVTDGKQALAREVAPMRDAWKAAYAKRKGLAVDAPGAVQAWSRYTRAAMAGASNLESTQSRKAVKAKGSKTEPAKGGAIPGAVAQANAAAPMPEETAEKVPTSKGQRLALVVNQTRAGISEVGALIAGIDAKVKGRAELIAAFNRLADMGRDLEKAAVAVLS